MGFQPAGRRQVKAGMIIPVAFSLIAMAATVGGFVFWSTSNSDARAVQRQTALIDHAMRSYIQLQVANQQVFTDWDEAVAHTSTTLDPDWIEENLGTYYYDNFNYEQLAVLDDRDRPVYLMHDGDTVDPSGITEDYEALRPLVAKLRGEISAGALRAYLGGARAEMPWVADYVTIAGVPAIATVSPITAKGAADTGLRDGQPYLHIAVDFLDDSYAAEVGEANMVEGASFRATPSQDPDNAALPLLNSAGRIITMLEWRQDWPGRRLLSETILALGGVLLAIGLLVALLVNRVLRYSAELEAGRQKAEYQANHDTLTALPNRAYFEARLSELAAGQRQGKLALFMLDLDRFKQVNDTLGHPAGDELIRSVGARLRNSISTSGIIARLGGDEFAIIEPSISGAPEAMAMASRIVEVIGQPFDLMGNEASVGVSVGIALSATIAIAPAELVRRSDIALYEAKAQGRNRAVVYDPSMDVAVQQRHSIEAELREALRANDQITVVFEPIVDGHTGRIVGAEALPRWSHPALGEVARETFMAAAECSNLVEILGELVLREACRLGAGHRGRLVAVNVALAQIRNPKFFSRLFDILAETGMMPADLVLEITETVLLKGGEAAGEVLRKLQAAGVRVALDDFGSGYSSLTFLKLHDVDHIKIDRAFALDAGDDSSALAIVEAMVRLAHAMDISVTAKGIDSALLKTRFAAIGCDRFQGAQIASPLSIEAMAAAFKSGGSGMRADAA